MKWELVREPEEILPIPHSFFKTVRTYSGNIALQILTSNDGIKKWTYLEIAQMSISLANEIKSAGVKKGDRIAIYGQYNPEWIITYLAIQLVGAIGVPLDNRLTYREVNHFLNNSEAKLLFVSEELLNQDIEISTPIKMPEPDSKFEDFKLPDLSLDDNALIL